MSSITAMSAGNGLSSAASNLSSQKSLECPTKGVLLKVLKVASGERKPKGEVFNIQVLVLRYLGYKCVLQLTRDLPSSASRFQIDDVLEYAQLSPTDSCISVIDKKRWRKCFGSANLKEQCLTFKKAPSLQSLNTLRTLNKFASIPVEQNAGFALMILPEGLTLNKLIKLAKNPKAGHKPAVISRIYGPIATQYGDMPVEGGVVAISKGLLVGSKNLCFKEQSKWVARNGCQMPRMVEAVALAFLTYINSSAKGKDPVCLLSSDFSSYTRCIEQIPVQWASYQLAVGGFAPAGLVVSHSLPVFAHCGIVALRRL